MDTLGQILWFGTFVTPLLAVPLVWKISKQRSIVKVLIGLLIAVMSFCILYYLSLMIIFREGMGPG